MTAYKTVITYEGALNTELTVQSALGWDLVSEEYIENNLALEKSPRIGRKMKMTLERDSDDCIPELISYESNYDNFAEPKFDVSKLRRALCQKVKYIRFSDWIKVSLYCDVTLLLLCIPVFISLSIGMKEFKRYINTFESYLDQKQAIGQQIIQIREDYNRKKQM